MQQRKKDILRIEVDKFVKLNTKELFYKMYKDEPPALNMCNEQRYYKVELKFIAVHGGRAYASYESFRASKPNTFKRVKYN